MTVPKVPRFARDDSFGVADNELPTSDKESVA